MGRRFRENAMGQTGKPRRWTVIASGLLCGVLALVVIFTTRRAFFSPLAVLVVAAIGLAAVLLQVRFYERPETVTVRPPVWLNLVGVALAVMALFAKEFGLGSETGQMIALGAVGCFAISGAFVLHAFRKQRMGPK